MTNMKIRDIFDYDKGKLYWKVRPARRIKIGDEAGCLGNRYYQIQYNKKQYKRSHLIFLWHNGRWPYPECDHINRDSHDDKIENLREATDSQNNMNRGLFRNSSTGKRGVYKNNSKKNPYMATLMVNKKSIYLGSFPTKEAASCAYQEAAKQHFSQFHREI